MLSIISPVEAAPQARALTRTGTPLMRLSVSEPGARSLRSERCVRSLEAAIGRPAAAAVVFARPRPQASTATFFGNSQIGSSQIGSSRMSDSQLSKNQPNQEKSGQKYTHTTRVAAAGGGAVGPHPARDPV